MSRTVVLRGERLGRALGLTDLWIAFNGYWPERGALFETLACFIVIPSSALPRMRLREAASPVVRLIVLNDAEYSDAIAFAEAMSRLSGFYGEGGVRNIGRRDGLATVLYSASRTRLFAGFRRARPPF
jgi:cysteate synthase